MRLLSCIMILIGCAYVTSAQNYVDVARIYFNNTPANQFEGSTSKTMVTEMGLDVLYPMVTKFGSVMMSVTADRTHVRLNPDANYSDLTSITLRGGLNIKHSDKWSGTYLLMPKLASDFKQSSNNFQMGAVALLRYNKSESMNYKMGLFFNTELFGPFIVPVLGLYKIFDNKKWEVNILLPSSADFSYRISNFLATGINFTGQIKTYQLSGLTTLPNAGYVRKSTNEITGYLKFNLTKNLNLYTRLGYTVGRAYRVYADDDKITMGITFIKIGKFDQQLNTDFSNGIVYQAILVYRVFTN